jgi:soluble lytic murein transglycosylase-like protein
MKSLVVLSIGLALSSAADANIYKYHDDNGRTYFSNIEPVVFVPKPIAKPAVKKLNKRVYTKEMIMRIAYAAAKRHGVDSKLVKAVIQTESAYHSTAISNKGAVGLMQLIPVTAERFGVVDRTDPFQNIDGGTKYLKHLLTLFKGNKKLALAGYNAGENAVIRHNRKIPPYPETINYVVKVLNQYQILRAEVRSS